MSGSAFTTQRKPRSCTQPLAFPLTLFDFRAQSGPPFRDMPNSRVADLPISSLLREPCCPNQPQTNVYPSCLRKTPRIRAEIFPAGNRSRRYSELNRHRVHDRLRGKCSRNFHAPVCRAPVASSRAGTECPSDLTAVRLEPRRTFSELLRYGRRASLGDVISPQRTREEPQSPWGSRPRSSWGSSSRSARRQLNSEFPSLHLWFRNRAGFATVLFDVAGRAYRAAADGSGPRG